jgi:hypothetical protein
MGVGEWLGYCHCNQVMTPIAVAVSNAVSLLEQINTALGSWCELLTWQMLFFHTNFQGPPEARSTHLCCLVSGQHQLSHFLPWHRLQRTWSSWGSSSIMLCWSTALTIWCWSGSSFISGVGSNPSAHVSWVQFGDENSTSYLTTIIAVICTQRVEYKELSTSWML